MNEKIEPRRGEIWRVDLGDTIGHEQRGVRPCLIVSFDKLNLGTSGLTIVLPLTSVDKRLSYNIRVSPPEGGLKTESYIKCEDMRSVSKDRLIERWGPVSDKTMYIVEDWLRILLGL